MASISHEKATGLRTIQVVGTDGKRHSIRLGKVNAKQAESAKLFVEDLATCRVSGSSPKTATAEWLAGLPDKTRNRVERAGLTGPRQRRECPTLGEWLRIYVEGRRDVKPNTLANYKQARDSLIEFFGKDKHLDEITPGDAEEFRVFLKVERKLAEGTLRRRCKRAKQFFTAAIKKKIIAENPFAGIKCSNYANAERFYFVSIAEAEAVLDSCPDAEWRLIFALCRFGGLRCPSEVLRLRWEDIDWSRSRMTVHASKTEHHEGGGIRQVPIFPELHPHLRDCFENAEPGQVSVVNSHRRLGVNLRTQLTRIIERAGLTPWPKLFQNLRSTRETELAEKYPLHVVCAWIGNSQPVAAKHYLQVTDEHFAKALQNPVHFPVQYAAARPRTESQQESEGEAEPVICGTMRENATPRESGGLHGIPPRGLEPLSPG